MKRSFLLLFSLTIALFGLWFGVVSVISVSAEPTTIYTVDTTIDYDPNATHPDYCTVGWDCPLRAAVEKANQASGSTINFDLPFNSMIELTHGELLITETMTINGLGENWLDVFTTDDSRIFNIVVPDDAVVTLQNFTIYGGAGNGGGQGGNIYFRVTSSNQTATLRVYSMTVDAGTTESASHGGNLYVRGNLDLHNSTVSNGVGRSGGNIYVSGNLDMLDSTVSDGFGTRDGGGIYAGENVTVTDSIISSNVISGTFNFGDGGGLYVDRKSGAARQDILIDNSSFYNNASKTTGNGGDGGGVFIDGSNSYTVIRDSTFAGNSAESGNGGYGGAVYAYGHSLEISNTTFRQNVAVNTTYCRGYGGALYASTNLNPITITQSTFDRNEGCLGGAIYNPSRNYLIEDTLFKQNKTNHAFGRGGAIYGAAQIHGGSFEDNESEIGGAIYVSDCSETFYPFSVDGTIFSGNSASEYGGAISVFLNCSYTISDATFTSNQVTNSDGCGGAISNNQGNSTILRSTFTQNDAAFGAAICSNVFIAGGFTLQDARLTLDQVTLQNNTFTGVGATTGGGLYVSNGIHPVQAVVTVTASTFSQNSADLGGGIAITGSHSTLNLTNSTLSQNNALGGDGGGLFVDQQATVVLRHATIVINQASNGGGIRSLNGSSVTAENSIVANNFAVRGRSSGNCQGSGIIGFGFNLDSDGTCLGFSIQNTNPQLAALTNNGGPTATHLPIAGSPVIDAAEASACATAGNIDQRGYTRPAGLGCDLGAVERDAIPTAVGLIEQQVQREIWLPLLVMGLVLVGGSGVVFGRKQ
ncbi:MAG TPA: hypothetical protein ENJ56_00425 [Anaerolineae bacterium]|nr:hypothetical protein [Anaerolineae bacterium]